VKISEIPKDSKVYLKIEDKHGGVSISSVHLYASCRAMVRSSDASFRRLVVLDPNQLDDEQAFQSTLLQGLRICERCRHHLEKQLLKGVAQ
jgi:hypothetical protein